MWTWQPAVIGRLQTFLKSLIYVIVSFFHFQEEKKIAQEKFQKIANAYEVSGIHVF